VPWIVYTCGPMGAGKGHVLSWMSRNGFFPIEDIVHIDPDHFKKLMPEWEKYTKVSDRAGDLCHQESCLMQEIAQEVAMGGSQNIWVDGSLRDGEWFAKVFCDIRRRFPHYKIAIFEIGASEAVVRQRIAKRAADTGRDVPEHLILASLKSVASSLDLLTPLCDFVARISNENAIPKLRAFIRVDQSGDWGMLQTQFAKPEMGQFPDSLAPIFLSTQKISPTDPILLERSDDNLTAHLNVEFPGLEHIRSAFKDPWLTTSIEVPVPILNPKARAGAGIPAEAETFCFVYPARINRSSLSKPDRDGTRAIPVCLLVTGGGFCYFDSQRRLCGFAGVRASAYQTPSHCAQCGILQFEAPISLSNAQLQMCVKKMQPVTFASLLSKGATRFCWIAPGEMSRHLPKPSQSGAFAYELAGRGGVYFPVVNEHWL